MREEVRDHLQGDHSDEDEDMETGSQTPRVPMEDDEQRGADMARDRSKLFAQMSIDLFNEQRSKKVSKEKELA